ncbi:unnamed protein product (macronuclear) [Paramecium tetraurelia]|uniref:Serine/threonine-protein phosphatase 4 regulatory subunit 3-like central domain-containing protein n=1 Tax=Paramecium tetraurelia TaxID=5888 RepID=A0CER5_PARTE|nr:uncharacterized protein GSPATT00037721001 [Paramecium tetraurelia]CAK69282.1 unnamed protein product [Paramecium tetraurelia]|eukprot:XP_001436679.1 hypothetical protein (macronuclear) [Paramecium tetraurelia strain d4-2]
MFFNFARFFTQQQQLDTLLTNPDCDLESILSADGILQEIKGLGATKFADHVLKHPEMYQKMINYIIQFEDELIDKKTQIQFPFLTSEILGSQNQKLIDYLFECPEEEIQFENQQIRQGLYGQLLSFLENDILNVTSAGYFAKAFIAIIKKRGFDVWATIIKNKAILSNLIKHIDIKHIAEIIEKLIILDTSQENYEEKFFEERKELLERIIKLLQHKSYNTEIVDNVCDILIEITSKSMSSLYYNNGEIIPFIDIIKKPDLFLNIALQTQRIGPYQLLINLVEMQSKETKKEDDDEVVHNLEKDYSIFESILSELPPNLLNQDYHTSNFVNSNRHSIQPFGLARMHLLKLIQVLVQTNDLKIIKTLINCRLIGALQTIILKYESNNQIHACCDKILRAIIDLNQDDFTQDVFENNDLLNYIVQNHTVENIKKGFIGFMTQISNYLEEKAKQNNKIQKFLRTNEQWQQFTENILNNVNSKEKPYLCNANPRPSQEPDVLDEQETDNILNILRKFNNNFQKSDKHVGNNENGEGVQRNTEVLNEFEQDQQEDNLEEEGVQETQGQQDQYNDDDQNDEDDKVKQEYNESNFWKLDVNEKLAQELLDNFE